MAVWGAQEELLVMTHDVSYDGGVFGHTEMGREAFYSPVVRSHSFNVLVL